LLCRKENISKPRSKQIEQDQVSRTTLRGSEVIMSKGSEEAGRRIKAAVNSYLMGYKGVDRTLKEMGDEHPGEFWSDVAEKLLQSTNGEVAIPMSREILGTTVGDYVGDVAG
jgi:hypothetical protein